MGGQIVFPFLYFVTPEAPDRESDFVIFINNIFKLLVEGLNCSRSIHEKNSLHPPIGNLNGQLQENPSFNLLQLAWLYARVSNPNYMISYEIRAAP